MKNEMKNIENKTEREKIVIPNREKLDEAIKYGILGGLAVAGFSGAIENDALLGLGCGVSFSAGMNYLILKGVDLYNQYVSKR